MSPFEAIKAVEAEFLAARFSLGRVLETSERDPSDLQRSQLRPANLRTALINLEPTYVIRLFALFEAVLRRYWQWRRRVRQLPRTWTETLINRVAADAHVPDAVLRDAHAVRAFRNSLVHEGTAADVLTARECRARLNQFLSALPRVWVYSPDAAVTGLPFET